MSLTYKIAQSSIDRYSAGPTATRTSQVKALHENIRSALDNSGAHKYDTFLQGSYRNGTAIKEINDVDIVALYDPWRSPATASDWGSLFDEIANVLRRTSLVTGAVSLGDKCVKLGTSPKADVVPAISQSPYSSTDPVMIYSRSNRQERPNYPRTHYSNGVKKQAAAGDTYKATVRLFKRWARQYESLVAPSFYIECAVHSVPSSKFDSYLPLSFARVGTALLGYTTSTVILSVAGDKDILVSSEWQPSNFSDFQRKLTSDVRRVMDAMQAPTATLAEAQWKLAFGDY